jgi:2-methylcitrate dehydratase
VQLGVEADHERRSAAELLPLLWNASSAINVSFDINVLPLKTQINQRVPGSPSRDYSFKLEITFCVRGVVAALLAEKGYTGPEHVIDGKEGLTHVFAPEWKLELLTDGLGESWRITQCGMKAFPTEALTHTPISAVLDLVKTNDLHPNQVQKIQIRSLARAADILSDPSKYDPHTKETADHSLPYVIAAALVERQVTPVQFTTEKILDPEIREQLRKVEVVADPEIEKVFPALQRVIVNIDTTDGRKFSKRLDYPKR